jgi:hypothetical protein
MRLLFLSCAIVASAALLTGCSKGGADSSAATPAATAAATGSAAQVAPAVALGTHYPPQGHKHFAEGESTAFHYNSDPPTSGPHKELFNDTFVSPTPLPKLLQVHLLEHGNVLLQYNCECPDVAAALAQIAYEYDAQQVPPSHLQPLPADVQAAEEGGLAVIVAPYPGMKHKIALTAWTRLATLDRVDKSKIEGFINAYLHNAANLNQ